MLGKSKSVLFIDNSDSDFTGNDLNSTKVRGTESSLILLAESFVKKNIKIVKRIRTELEAHTTKYRVSTPIEDMIPERYCACTSSSTTITLKAAEMMIQNQKLTDFLAVNGLSVTEYPLLKVTRWNHNSQEIDFDFCFPVPKNRTYPKFEGVTLKNIPKENALKTIFNGNYISNGQYQRNHHVSE